MTQEVKRLPYMNPHEEYAVALKVSCPWHECGVTVGQRCNDELFPHLPHLERVKKALKAGVSFPF